MASAEKTMLIILNLRWPTRVTANSPNLMHNRANLEQDNAVLQPVSTKFHRKPR